jgi:cytochrome o ubiquinol oxidase operon protein cyoD
MHNATLKSYITGFILSIVLTLAAYFLVITHFLMGNILLAAILGLAIVQLIVQVIYFLHISKEEKPHWNLIFLGSFISIIALIVVASLWIMAHLNYNMSPTQMNTKAMQEEGFKK